MLITLKFSNGIGGNSRPVNAVYSVEFRPSPICEKKKKTNAQEKASGEEKQSQLVDVAKQGMERKA